MSGPRPRLVLVDGSAYIYRAFYALPPLTGPRGLPTNAVYGFTTMLLKLLSEVRPQYAAVVFDAPGATFRDDLYAHYKANRSEMPGDLAAQIPWIHRVVAALRLYEICVPGVEADDVIASLIAAHADEIDTVIVTSDKDLMQLVGPHVRLWDTMRDRWTDTAAVEAKFGVPPERVVDVMALVGDSIDNIPGVAGIGEKTAVALIQTFGDLENVLTRLDAVAQMSLRGARKVAERLRADAATARLSRELARIRRDVALDCTLEDLHVAPADHAAARPLFTELGFHSLLRQLSEEAPTLRVDAATVDDAAQLERQFARARAVGSLTLCALSDPGPGVSTPACGLVLSAGGDVPVHVPLGDPALRAVAAAALAAPQFEIIGHDLKRDALRLAACGIELGGPSFDAMIAAALTDPAAGDRLELLAAELLGARPAPYREGVAGAAAGVSVLQQLAAELRARLDAFAVRRLFDEVEMPLVGVLARMERRGMLVDVERLRALSSEFSARMDALMGDIFALAGGEFNIGSPPQLRAVLFDRLGLSKRGVRRGKTGFSTDVDVLTRLAQEHPLPAKILDYRALAKLKSTYVDALPAAVNAATGRLHTSLNQTGAATGRLSSSEPNLQNIPIRGEEGRRIRAAFVAPPGSVLIAADYSQIELRILAHLSGDPALVDAFTRGQDVHARTAAEVFRVQADAVTADMRRVAKVINFGIIYGMGPQRLANELGIPLGEAQQYIANYFERYAGVRRYMETVVADARERGFATTILGRRRPIPELRSPERGVAQAAERVAANTPIQGSAADLIKQAMVAIDRRLRASGVAAGMILQVHDELLLEAEEGVQEAVSRAVGEEMEGVMRLAVPLRVDVGVGRSWAEAH
jgi:DNA polymerase-1